MTSNEGERDLELAASEMRHLPRLKRDLAMSAAENVTDIREHHRRWDWIDARQQEGGVE